MKVSAKMIQSILVLIGLSVITCNCARQVNHSACGLEPELPRILRIGKPSSVPSTALHLIQVRKEKEKTILIVGVTHSNQGKFFISPNRGDEWTPITSETGKGIATNIRILSSAHDPYLASFPNAAAIYGFDSDLHCIDSVSTDRGGNWAKVKPRLDSGREILECDQIGIYGDKGERVYLWMNDGKTKGTWISKDFGKNFRPLSSEIQHLVECLANPKVMYGFGGDYLWKSMDGGINWQKLESSEFILRPIFQGDDGFLKTFDATGNDQPDGYPNRIESIRTDPKRCEIFYVLTCKGIFRSTDGGKSFVLLPFKIDEMLGIGNIAVDPVDGRYIYAITGMNSLYRSNDRGCTWSKLNVPLQ